MKLNSTLLVLVGGLWYGGAAQVHAQAFSVIKSFGVAGNVTGCNPACELVQDATGALYGTTSGGEGRGTVFKMQPDGSGFQVLKMFTNTLDGAYPGSVLVLSGSTLYGATAGGGSGGSGTLFSLGLDGSGFTVLKSFSSTDPGKPQDGLALSGSTLFGALSDTLSRGAVFRIETDGTGYTVLKQFTFFDDAFPRGRLLLSGDTLYGTISPRSSFGLRAVFSLGTNGSGYTIVRSFSFSEGDPSTGLMLNGGTFYGVTSSGGSFACTGSSEESGLTDYDGTSGSRPDPAPATPCSPVPEQG